jgi:hypothetical protein
LSSITKDLNADKMDDLVGDMRENMEMVEEVSNLMGAPMLR